MIIAATAGQGASLPAGKAFTNSIGLRLVRIESGSFRMGAEPTPLSYVDRIWGYLNNELVDIPAGSGKVRNYLQYGNYDEKPRHKVTLTKPFFMGTFEVANVQYEQFDPGHHQLRGTKGYSTNDDDAVVMVNWNDAVKFCEWLSSKEGLPYRLPTEAEWEFACRAGTTTPFSTGNTLPSNAVPANAWGLHDMHGNAEEWCHDWYGPYAASAQLDPIGRADGEFKVTRGGSYTTHNFYRRSANRSGTVADDRSWTIGFRVVLGERPHTKGLPVVKQRYQQKVKQTIPKNLAKGPDPKQPYFDVRRYVNIPTNAFGPLFYKHNHNPDIVQCPNGDLLAINFSTVTEGDREMVYAVSRLRFGRKEWDASSVFWAPPDRKSEYSALWEEGGTIYNFSSLGIGESRPSAVVMRTSRDNGVTWSKPRTILPRADNQGVMESVSRAMDGSIMNPADSHNLLLSRDNGQTWFSPVTDKGGAGIHRPLVQLRNGDLMTIGRGDDIDGMMPKSISHDMGKTWTYSATPFTKIAGGQRATMLRLKEGPILFASFAKGMTMLDGLGRTNQCDGLYAALSYDEGETWPVMQLVNDGPGRKIFTRRNEIFETTATKSEGGGYLASCQSADGVIHVVGNRVEYAFNLEWLIRHQTSKSPPRKP